MKTLAPIFSIIGLIAIITLSGPVHAAPDLVISEMSISPSAPVKGEPVTVRVGVYNRGNQRSGPFVVKWKAGENYRNSACAWRVPGLNARGGRILTCTYEGYPSWYARINCMAKADANSEVTEQNEGNNVRKMRIRVAGGDGDSPGRSEGRPDLYVSEFSMNPSTPVKGEPVTVRIGVYNKGDAPSGPFLVQWRAGENYTRPARVWRINSMAARGGRILTFTYPGYPSWYSRLNTLVVVDPNDEVSESNERNNRKRQRIRVARP
ncbi:hypothetical protein GF413_04675 [Candidatus Micrarchaeota archaeon]|nr:hypothetical protein [Candidatus Micrarchaeota archaeon]